MELYITEKNDALLWKKPMSDSETTITNHSEGWRIDASTGLAPERREYTDTGLSLEMIRTSVTSDPSRCLFIYSESYPVPIADFYPEDIYQK